MRVFNTQPTPEVVDGGLVVAGNEEADVPDGERVQLALDAGRLVERVPEPSKLQKEKP